VELNVQWPVCLLTNVHHLVGACHVCCNMYSQMEVLPSVSLIVKYVGAKGFQVAWDCSRPQKIFEDCWMRVYRIDRGVSFRRGGDIL